MTTYLIIGNCGVGKTWLMKQLINKFQLTQTQQIELYHYLHNENVAILGKYTGDTFDGSDGISMSVMSCNNAAKQALQQYSVVAEGDRFTNSSFIRDFSPIILKVLGDGKKGRELRGSNQTERHLKSIATRVANIYPHYEFKNNEECLQFIINKIEGVEQNDSLFIPAKTTLF